MPEYDRSAAADPAASSPACGRLLRDLRHGAHVLAETSVEAKSLAVAQESITTWDAVVAEPVGLTSVPDSTTAFGYLFADLAASFPAAHLPIDDPAATVAHLQTLGAALVEEPPPPDDPRQSQANSSIPAVYTYWGQFLDHDLTANTDRDSTVSDITSATFEPLSPDSVTATLRNLRHPALNLDSVYGDGPTLAGVATTGADMYDGIKLRLGRVAETSDLPERPLRGEKIPPVTDTERDLPRLNKMALIGDGRNDENLIVAQLHVAFLRFHNAAVDWVRAHEPEHTSDSAVFARARDLTRWHYQWLVVHDYLKTVAWPGSTDQVLYGGNQVFTPAPYEPASMPLEFSVGAFRFGHSMVRGAYDFNRNFGRPGQVLPDASFFLLFAFTGNGAPQPFFGDTTVLPFNWVIEWDRFVHRGSAVGDHFARRIDTRLAPPLRNLSKEGNQTSDPRIRSILKSLAARNLLRGYLLALPTGQAVASALGVAALTPEEVLAGNHPLVNDALIAGGFVETTPLWYYVLKEAEVHAAGNSLGAVGSAIVNETVLGQLRADAGSYLHVPGGWDPSTGLRLADGQLITTIADFLTAAGVR